MVGTTVCVKGKGSMYKQVNFCRVRTRVLTRCTTGVRREDRVLLSSLSRKHCRFFSCTVPLYLLYESDGVYKNRLGPVGSSETVGLEKIVFQDFNLGS